MKCSRCFPVSAPMKPGSQFRYSITPRTRAPWPAKSRPGSRHSQPARLSDPGPWHQHLGGEHRGGRAYIRGRRSPDFLRTPESAMACPRYEHMSRLTVYTDSVSPMVELDTRDGRQIAAALREIGVRFERWEAPRPLSHEDGDQVVMDLYHNE